MDGVNFDTIDTPVKAALLPIMDPAVLTSVIAGSVLSGSGNAQPGAIASADILTGTNAQPASGGSLSNEVRSTFIIHPDNQQQPVTEGGLLGDLFDSGKLQVDLKAQTITWAQTGDIALTMTIDEKNSIVHVDGHMGTVDAHLQMKSIDSKALPKDSFGIHTDGTLGGQSYLVDTVFTIASMGNKDGGTGIAASISAHGKLGDADIQKDYTLTGSQKGDTAQLDVHGKGVVAGVPTQVDVEAHLAH